MNKTTKLIVRQAIVAGVYTALTLLLSFMSYGDVQFRIAEILVLLAFYKKEYFIGLVLGCFLANLGSPILAYDLVFGVGASALAILAIMYLSKNLYIAAIWPVIFNGLIVGLELHLAYSLPYWTTVLSVALGEAVVMVVGVIVFKLLEKNKQFMHMITDKQD